MMWATRSIHTHTKMCIEVIMNTAIKARYTARVIVLIIFEHSVNGKSTTVVNRTGFYVLPGMTSQINSKWNIDTTYIFVITGYYSVVVTRTVPVFHITHDRNDNSKGNWTKCIFILKKKKQKISALCAEFTHTCTIHSQCLVLLPR